MTNDWHEQKTYDSLITFGLSGIKFILIANGGALVSIIGLLGKDSERMESLFFTVLIFSAGVAVGGIVNITAYLTQLTLFNEHKSLSSSILRNHESWLYLSLLLILSGIGCFIAGSITAAIALAS